MNTIIEKKNWIESAEKLAESFIDRDKYFDKEGEFVVENYEDLKEHRFFSAAIPEEIGGGGISHAEMADILRVIGKSSPSTGLALSMHQHLVAANIWKYKRGQGGDDVLSRVSEKQLVLVSTGARDWLESNGNMQKVEGGYLVTAQKHFASQSSAGDVLVTSAPYLDGKDWKVLHFPVPFNAEGLKVLDNWDTMGMRGTGSNTVVLDNVFVPDSAISLERPQGEFHPFWNVVLTVAMPLIMAVYVGIAEKAVQIAVTQLKKRNNPKEHVIYKTGEMNNYLTSAQVQWKDMLRITNDFDFDPVNENSHEILTRKTNVTKTCIKTVELAMDAVGAQSYFVNQGLEKLFRDVQAAKYHPLAEMDQYLFSGRFILDNDQN